MLEVNIGKDRQVIKCMSGTHTALIRVFNASYTRSYDNFFTWAEKLYDQIEIIIMVRHKTSNAQMLYYMCTVLKVLFAFYTINMHCRLCCAPDIPQSTEYHQCTCSYMQGRVQLFLQVSRLIDTGL